jgi:hypothetical protein
LEDGINVANLEAETLEILAESEVALVITAEGVSAELPAELLAELLYEGYEFEITLEILPVRPALPEFTTVLINIAVDGEDISDFAVPVLVTVDVSNADFEWANPADIVAVLNPPISGVFDSAAQTFAFYAPVSGRFTITYMAGFSAPHVAPPATGQVTPLVAPQIITMRFAIGSTIYTIGGIAGQIEAAPFIDPVYERTMIPVRAIAEGLGATVDWDEATRTVFIIRGGEVITLTVGVPLPGDMGTAAIVDGRTFVPARYVSEVLNATVRWDGTNQAVYIYN